MDDRRRFGGGEIGVRETVKGLLAGGLLSLPGRDLDEKADRVARAWSMEPGPTRADLVNAITRAAHEEFSWSSPWAIQETETQASELLYVKNLVNRVQAGRDSLN